MPEAEAPAGLLWWEVLAELLCECEHGTTIEDCTMPSRVTCTNCGRSWEIAFTVTEVKEKEES